MKDAIETPLQEPATTASAVEKFLWWIPLLGWMISGTLYQWRMQPLCDAINEQLSKRVEPTWAAWGDDPERVEVARVVCEEWQKEFDWVNDHFIPEDRVTTLTMRVDFDVELLFALCEMEKRLKLPPDKRSLNLHTREDRERATVGDIVDSFLKSVRMPKSK